MSEQQTISVSTRVPQSWVVAIERHRDRMRQERRSVRITIADALRDLIALGIESQEPGVQLWGGEQLSLPVLPEAQSVSSAQSIPTAPPGASAIEQAAAATFGPPAGMQFCAANPKHRPYLLTLSRCPTCANTANKRARRASGAR